MSVPQNSLHSAVSHDFELSDTAVDLPIFFFTQPATQKVWLSTHRETNRKRREEKAKSANIGGQSFSLLESDASDWSMGAVCLNAIRVYQGRI